MNAFCVLFSDVSNATKMNELSYERTLASVPFGGRFRLIDFMLSSLVGAKVNNIGIITRNKYGSLMDHVAWGKDWDLNRKNGGIKFLTPFLEDANAIISENKFDTLFNILNFIKTALPEYCILCDGNIVFNMDFSSMMKQHIEKKADITFAYKNMKIKQNDLEVKFDHDGRLVDTLYHSTALEEEANVEVNVIILKKDLLINLIEMATTYGWTSFKKDVFSRKRNEYNIYGFEIKGYTSVISSVKDFYKTNMDLLNDDVRKDLFGSENPILTRIKDSIPTIYGEDCNIKNSLIADGCHIEGTLENCIVFRDAKIEKGAVIKNSIIMQSTVVKKDAILSYVITDKDVEITEGKFLAGSANVPFVIRKGEIV